MNNIKSEYQAEILLDITSRELTVGDRVLVRVPFTGDLIETEVIQSYWNLKKVGTWLGLYSPDKVLKVTNLDQRSRNKLIVELSF